MKLLDRRDFLQFAAGASTLALASPASAQPLRSADVFTSDEAGTFVDSVVVLGETRAVLIDAQTDRANATALADTIDASGRTLETILITHVHPDHFLGLGVLMDRFPQARPVAHSALQPILEQAGPPMFDQIKAMMGPALADRVVIPEPLGGDTMMLEGERISILEPMHGDTDTITPVYVESLDTLITSDIAFSGTHAYVAENTDSAALERWRESLDALEATGAGTVIPGHRLEGSPLDMTAFSHTRRYLDDWEAAMNEASHATELRTALLERVGDLPVPFFVDQAVAAVYP
ncbi:MBL fold metallo-hydrolase [Gymnodinialimonas sp. 2305UL16-5]|uniref:MBL fold metallo-hydrolase n=1 Tax=Gymnodinialimonas mytili TaxID=3126503 RepID=UPI00309F2E7E